MASGSQPSSERVAEALQWGSVALGAPPVLSPGRFARAIGVAPTSAARAWAFAVGVRELGAAGGMFAEGRRPVRSTWARVGGDAMDAALLATALRRGADDPRRTRAALGAVLAIAAADLTTAIALGRKRSDQPMRVDAMITTIKPSDEVEQAWTTSAEIAEIKRLGTVDVEFAPAPGDGGTEIHVTLEADVSGGAVGAAAAKLAGTSPRQQVYDHLRRFKQLLETGEVARSDGAPDGITATAQPKQRPAQPVEHAST